MVVAKSGCEQSQLDLMPQIVQQLMRLKDIRRRIEAGASIEAIGEQIQRTAADNSTPH
jgi:hypothetical protein